MRKSKLNFNENGNSNEIENNEDQFDEYKVDERTDAQKLRDKLIEGNIDN